MSRRNAFVPPDRAIQSICQCVPRRARRSHGYSRQGLALYDVIIVGARCAGAPTAMLLSGMGYKVLLLDRANFPSDSPTSTRLIHPPGVAKLQRWGLLEEILACGCPPIYRYGLAAGPVNIMADLPLVDGVNMAYSPDREVLDHVLVKAAVGAGAELRENVSVSSLLRDEAGSVIGAAGKARSGGKFEERAHVVVGADGTNSTIARLVGAPKYNVQPTRAKSWWTYWDGLPLDNEVATVRANQKHGFAWPTHDGLAIVGMTWKPSEFDALTTDPEASFTAAYEEVAPEFATRLRAGKQAGRWICGSVPNFFRKPYGPGWALVGDASYSKDPCTAAGITDAMGGAELLSAALDRGLSGRATMNDALAEYEQARNTKAFQHYDYTCDMADLHDYSPEELDLMGAIAKSPRHATGLLGVFSDATKPADFFSADNIHELFGYMEPNQLLSWRMRVLHWIITGPPSRFKRPVSMADKLMAQNMGEMGKFLLGNV
ncbi:NAD(P)/FAD-dependent oxidoreductase [Nocardia sp. BMG51109]|uniref:NAD(P)/FAD-dependent oxidoreductase n=1 Tax=Nocardia sp. BMG51109 TaxID=1056816 RepID=UPI002100E18F|nr:NAD(P)/FAD-dependent oxidoreductase [Nocardia sp. BMG51109]